MKRSILLTVLTPLAAILLAAGCTTPTGDGQTPAETFEYVADKMNDRIVMLDSEGNVLDMCEVVRRPTDLSLYPGVEALWVANYSLDNVLKLDLNLNITASTAEGLLNDPIAVAVTADDECWVADRVNHGFVRLNSDAEEVGRVTVDGPTRCVAYDAANGYCWCADESGNLYAFDDGLVGQKSTADARVTFTGLGVVRGLAVDPDGGRIWVGDSGGDRVLCLETDGGVSFIATDIGEPMGLSLDSSGNCWVAARGGSVMLLSAEDGSVLERYDGLNGPVDVAAEPGGGVWVVEETGNKVKLLKNGDTVVTAEGFSSPAAVAVYAPDLW